MLATLQAIAQALDDIITKVPQATTLLTNFSSFLATL